ncbi:hypothetical protein FHS31_001409 [Sphingomonas vulcanisoli]|uniref:TonB-dependent receptor n=1 Tax=Sphingomonas vulcanisoli TaxID=1658060 RepID=A0ABX0TSS6_9SPHN|nr:hypothetical protein [Sphingomonas vulcanisoli]NIJ07799.1 hypothetical protein [Sphingomonas vulcanisoli]
MSSAASAATTTFGGVVTARAGYGKNPNFQFGDDSSGALFGGTLSATLARLTAKGRTALTGTADLAQATGGSGRTENYLVQLSHAQQFTPKFSLSGDIAYDDSTNPSANYSTESRDLVPIGDALTIGTHTRQISGDINAAYQLDSKDLFQGGLDFAHTTYASGIGSTYTQYGGSLGYLRTISAATRIGFQLSALHVASDNFPGSSSFTGGLALTQKIGPRWTFQGGVNGVLQKQGGASFKTIGFNGSLCGDYPRYTICVLGSRQSAASGIGGLRIDTQGGARLSYKLSAVSTLSGTLTYDISNSNNPLLPTQRYIDGAVTYARTITQRLSAGVSGRYQRRTSDSVNVFTGGRTVSYVGTVNVSYAFGRTS